MGNLSFIVPTKNIKEFNREKIYQLLLVKFPDLTIDMVEEFDSIQVRDKDNNLVEDIYFNQDIYILEYKRDIQDLSDMKMYDLASQLSELELLKPDLNNIIQTTYGVGWNYDLKNDIDFLIKDYFSSYLFDEGIHPEYMAPDYKRKEKKRKEKTFGIFGNE